MADSQVTSKFVSADFCQGDVRFFDSSRGRQCVPNCITFLMKTLLKIIDEFNETDINIILIKGDMLYKKKYMLKI